MEIAQLGSMSDDNIDEIIKGLASSENQSSLSSRKKIELDIRNLDQEYWHRNRILSFTIKYTTISSLIVLAYLVGVSLVKGFLDKEIIDVWTLRIVVGSVITQFIGVLYLIAGRVFKK